MVWALILLTVGIVVELLFYFGATPHLDEEPIRHYPLENGLGYAFFLVAQILTLLRLPFILLPYCLKLLFILTQQTTYQRLCQKTWFDAVRVLGDGLNFWLMSFALLELASLWGSRWLVYAAILAEGIRLLTEKGQSIFTTIWQYLPHRSLARLGQRHRLGFQRIGLEKSLQRYIDYYLLPDEARLDYLWQVMGQRAAAAPDLQRKLLYLQAFRIVPSAHTLRAGDVRHIARGELYIYQRWSNDPWLVLGLALRRSPWCFDPRYLHRPFFYRSESNRLTTLLVLQNPRFSLPFTLYQLGHEIKAARFAWFFGLARRLGYELEEPVGADGLYHFDPFLSWLQNRWGHKHDDERRRPLWRDEQVLAEVTLRIQSGESLSPMLIAEQYTYPSMYVAEVLWAQIQKEVALVTIA